MASEIKFDVDVAEQQLFENSDAESCTSDASYVGNDDSKFEGSLFDNGMIRLNEDDVNFSIVAQKFLSSLSDFEGIDAAIDIEAIHKVNWLKSRKRKARFQCFHVYQHMLLQTQYEYDNGTYYDDEEDYATYCMDYAWFCDSNKQGIQNIISNGFGYRELTPYVGIRLSPMNSLLQSLNNCEHDDDGLKHVLLCKVLMNTKEVANENFPNYYVVPETKMNSHILPSYVVTFRVNQSLQGLPQAQQTWRKPASPWLPFATLLSALSEFLPRSSMRLIIESHKNFKAGKLSRRDWINALRRYAGTDLLAHALKSIGFDNEIQKSVKVFSRKNKRIFA